MMPRADVISLLLLIMAGDSGFFIHGEARPPKQFIGGESLMIFTTMKNSGPSQSGPGHRIKTARSVDSRPPVQKNP